MSPADSCAESKHFSTNQWGGWGDLPAEDNINPSTMIRADFDLNSHSRHIFLTQLLLFSSIYEDAVMKRIDTRCSVGSLHIFYIWGRGLRRAFLRRLQCLLIFPSIAFQSSAILPYTALMETVAWSCDAERQRRARLLEGHEASNACEFTPELLSERHMPSRRAGRSRYRAQRAGCTRSQPRWYRGF